MGGRGDGCGVDYTLEGGRWFLGRKMVMRDTTVVGGEDSYKKGGV